MEEMEKAKAALAQEVSRYSMAGVISFLEQEWFTFQDEREKWELDRKGLARQIQTLTEKNKALENVQYDLVRRIKMLEYALVQERARYSGVQTPAPEPLKEEDQRKPLERPQRKSKGILERYLNDFDLRTAQLLSSVDLRPPVDKEEPASAILSSLLAVKKNVSSIDSNSVTPGTSSLSKSSGKGDAEEGLMGTVRKAMGDREDSQKMDKKKANLKEALAMLKGQNKTDGAKKGSFGNGVQSGGSSGGGGSKKDAADEEEDFKAKIEKLRQSRREEGGKGKDQQQQQEKEKEQKKAKNEEEDGEESNNPTVKMQLSKFGKKKSHMSDKPVDSLGQLLGLEMELPLEISGDGSMGSMKRAAKSWQPQFILRHHLDVVRSVSFHEQEPILLSGSDDCTVKLWNWRSASTVGYKQPLSADIEPVYCFLGHTGAVYSVIMASQKKQCFSAGADTNIRIWQLPDSTQQDLYAERGKAITMDLGVLRGHTDAVWDLSYHPHRSLLVSSSSDATVKIWNVDNAVKGRGDPLMHTCLHPSNDPSNDDFIPTTVSFIPTDVNKLLVGYRTSELGVFDIETGKVVTLMAPTDTDASLSRLYTQMNKVVSHPHLDLAISAHEDRTVKFWDLKSGTCVHSMIAHQTVVSSLAVDPAGGYVLTAGHGCSLRFWEISTKNCVQEIHAHRQKHDEGIYSVAYHPTLELVASGGADAMIRVYQ